MIVSRENKFIFIHVTKVAGQSLSNALLPNAATSWQKAASVIFPYRYQLKASTFIRNRINLNFYPQPYRDHIRCVELLRLMGEEEFGRYFVFCFVRNPWDWVLSHYTYACKNPRHYKHKFSAAFKNFDEYVNWHEANNAGFGSQLEYISDEDGACLASYVGRYENLEEDFSAVCKTLEIPNRLPRLNSSRSGTYRDWYTDQGVQIVARKCFEDVEYFGYKF